MMSTPLEPRADIQQSSIGQRVRELRRQRNLTQKELAALAGLSVTAIYRIERGERAPSIRTIRKLEAVLDCGLVEIIGVKPDS